MAETNGSRRRSGQYHDRSDGRQADRSGYAAALDRAGDRRLYRLRRRLLAGFQLRLHEHDLVAYADNAACPWRPIRAQAFERIFGEAGTAPASVSNEFKCSAAFSTRSPKKPPVCKNGLGARDRARVNDYLDNIREIERRIQQTERSRHTEATALDAPVGVPDSFDEHVGLMFDLIAAAYQADVTRVFTFMMSRELSQRTYPQIGSHRAASQCVAPSEQRGEDAQRSPKSIPTTPACSRSSSKNCDRHEDGDGSLLDHSLVFYGAGMGDSNSHASDPLADRRGRRRRR